MRYWLLIILLGVILPEAGGQEKKKKEVWYGKWPVLGVRVGTDIGGALPFPFRYIPSEFAPKIKPKLTFGGEIVWPVSKQFSIGAEVNFKTVAIDADAFVEDQRFLVINEDTGESSNVFFTGMAEMNMSFSMVEIPVYAKYSFSGGRNRVVLGGYYAIGKKQSFDVIAKKGFMRDQPDTEDLSALDSDLAMSFNEQLDKWDAGVIFGYERYIIDNVLVSGKVNIGFKSIFEKGFEMLDYQMYHMRLAVGITYELVDFSKKYNLKRYVPSFRRRNKDKDQQN